MALAFPLTPPTVLGPRRVVIEEFSTVGVTASPFTGEQQMAEVKRVVDSAIDKARSTYQFCVISERLWRELEVENERHHPRAV